MRQDYVIKDCIKKYCGTLLYFHDIKANDDGDAIVKLYNENEKFGIYIKYSKKALPCFSQWKNNCEQNYVTGLELGTGLPIGRRDAYLQNAMFHRQNY